MAVSPWVIPRTHMKSRLNNLKLRYEFWKSQEVVIKLEETDSDDEGPQIKRRIMADLNMLFASMRCFAHLHLACRTVCCSTVQFHVSTRPTVM